MLNSIWGYRYFIFSTIRNELTTRFARSKLGALWILFNPLAQVLIYALILSNVLSARLPGIDNAYAFAIYLMAGMLAWSLFSDIINRSVNLFVENAGLLKKINFPRITLPIIMIGGALLNNLILFCAIVVIFTCLHQGFNSTVIWLIPLTATVILLAFGIGLILGVMNVFVRDIAQAIPILLQILFWFTPIVYPISIIPEQYQHWLSLNPLLPIITAYHDILVYGRAPDVMSFIYLNAVAVMILLLGLFMFKKASPEMVDVL